MERHEPGHDPRSIVIGRLNALLKQEFADEPFHNPSHSANVDNISFAVCDRIREIDPSLVSEQDELAREAAAWGHDSVIEYVDAITEKQGGERVRRRGFFAEDMTDEAKKMGPGNEQASAERILSLIQQVDPNHAIYKEPAIEQIKEGVAATFPAFAFEKLPVEKILQMDKRVRAYLDAEGKGLRIYQPHVKEEGGVVAMSLALGDLSSMGWLPVEDSIRIGDGEYREGKDKIGYLLKQGISKIPDEEKERIIVDMEKWINGQVSFFAWRKVETERLIESHQFKTSKDNQEKIKRMFRGQGVYKRFDEVITAAINRAEKYKDPSFKTLGLNEQLVTLARDIGYDL